MSHSDEKLKPLFYFHLKGGLLSLLLAVVSIGGATYLFSEKALISSVKDSLFTHAMFRKDRIQAFVEQQKQWMKTAAGSVEVVSLAEQIIGAYQDGGAGSNSYRWHRDRFRSEYRVMANAGGVHDLFLLTPQGELAFSLQPAEPELGMDLSADGFYGKSIFSELIEQVVARKELVISSYGHVEVLEKSVILMGIPLIAPYAAEGEAFAGILVRPLTLEWLQQMLTDYSGLGETGEVVVVQRESLNNSFDIRFINLSRQGMPPPSDSCQKSMHKEPERFPMWHAIREDQGSGWVIDHDCRPVYAVWNWIPELQWGMVVKQEESEVLQPVHQLRSQVMVAVLLSIALLVWLAQRQARQLARPIEQLTRAAERDELEVQQELQVLEVNRLNRAMQHLVNKLHTHEQELESMVARRTDELQREKSFVESIIHAMEEGMLVIDPEGRVIRANRKMELLLECDPCSLTCKQLFDRSIGEAADQRMRLLMSHSGGHIPVHVSEANFLVDQQDQTQSLRVLMIYDLRERLRAEEQEQYLAFQSGVAEMSAMVLHNIGNAMVGLNGVLYKGRVDLESLERILRALRTMHQRQQTGELDRAAIQRGLELAANAMEDLLGQQGMLGHLDFLESGFSHMGEIIQKHRSSSNTEVAAARFGVRAMLEDVEQLMTDRYQRAAVTLTIDCPAGLEVRMPRNSAIQSMINLLNNSLEAIEEARLEQPDLRGAVTVRAFGVEEARFELQVIDNGIGIEPEQQREIFGFGTTTKTHGSGYGLHVVGNFINSIGGDIRVESAGSHQGATMRLILPLYS